ncbi:MAG: plasmid partitioning protein [Sandaracinaceae bacterium]
MAAFLLSGGACADDASFDAGVTPDTGARDAGSAPDAFTPHDASDATIDAAAIDAGGEADGNVPDAGPVPSRCAVEGGALRCARRTETLFTGFTGLVPREVHWQVPLGEPPADGWPVVFVFQGSLFTAELFWLAFDTDAFGYWNQVRLIQALLDGGFAVLTPEAKVGGATAWDTNIPPASVAWESSADHRFMLDLFDAIEEGRFGPLDPNRWYATGISSGGYMTSRMDEAYRSRFRALAIHSASYATCAGAVCAVPDSVDAAHLPTLFLHGTADLVVPASTMELYRDRLDALGVETQTLTEPVGHAWLDAAPDAIAAWFRVR